MKYLSLARLGVALAIPLMMAGCEAPEPNHANSDPAIHAEEHGAGGGWCPLSALATCQAACDQVAQCSISPVFSEIQPDACAFECASGLMDDDRETGDVIACLAEVTSQHACCEVTGCAASWLRAPTTSTAADSAPQEETFLEEDSSVPPPLPVALGGDTCPPEARFTTNGAGLAFCLFEDITLPGTNIVKPYCHFVWDDYIGFQWPGDATPEGYECPDGFRTGNNPEGSLFCVYNDLNVPNTPTLRPYCDFLEEGVLGYQWCLDPLAASCPQTPPPHSGQQTTPPQGESAPETLAPDAGGAPQTETPGEARSDTETVETSAAVETAEQGGSRANEDDTDSDPGGDEDPELGPDPVVVQPPEDEESGASPDEDPQSTLVEDHTEEDEGSGLPDPVSASEPEGDEEDLRCESMCLRLDHCGGLQESAIPEVQECVNLCHSWGYAFQKLLFNCSLALAETCDQVLACWTPGG